MLARPTRSAPSLDLVSMSEVITAIAFRNGSYSLVPAHEISPGAKSEESGPDRQLGSF